jgi:hypothetical protein
MAEDYLGEIMVNSLAILHLLPANPPQDRTIYGPDGLRGYLEAGARRKPVFVSGHGRRDHCAVMLKIMDRDVDAGIRAAIDGKDGDALAALLPRPFLGTRKDRAYLRGVRRANRDLARKAWVLARRKA